MIEQPIRILHLEDDINDAQLIHAKLESDRLLCDIVRVKDRQSFEAAVMKGCFDLIMSDFSVPHFDGFAALKFARERDPDIPFILVSGTLGEEQAVTSLKNGATDYIVKQRLERLGPAVERALSDARERKEHKKIEQRLREEAQASEMRFRTLVEEALVGIYMIENDKFVYVNPSLTEILGFTAEEIKSRPLLDFIHPDDQGVVYENIRQRMQGEMMEAHYTLRMLRRDQSVAFAEARGRRIDFNGRPVIMGTLLDITERKQAENAIREQAALLDKAQDAICVNDMEQKILYWNKSAERLYGWTAQEAVGKNANDLLFQGDLSAPMLAVPQLIRDGEWKGELNQITRNGQKLIVESRWSLLRDENGNPRSVLIINTDVTEKKQTEAKFLRTQRMESIGALAGGIAHDLNNSLAPILMAAELLKDELQTDSSKALLDLMTGSAQKGADMVKQILSFSRGVAGEHGPLKLKALIEEMEKFTRSTFPRSIRVRTEIEESILPVLGDATQIHQVLMNLCINARDAMASGGQLLIKVSNYYQPRTPAGKETKGSHIVLSVSDTGQGMAPDVINKIFEPFFTTKEFGKGTGLGLSTVMEIVKTHRGFVEVSSEVGKGTTFHVFLPAVEKAQQTNQERALPPAGSGELILVVDDDTALLEMSKLVFEAYNYQIITAKDGAEGLGHFQKHHTSIKAVITDMMMPNMSGPELIRKLREINPDVRIIGVSGVGSEMWLGKVGKVDVDAFLKKPFSTESLLVKLHELTQPG